MTEQNAQDEAARRQDSHESWTDATDRFAEAVGEDLGDRFAPQMKALRALAEQLDTAETYEATMAAEYARMHRWLLNKTGARGGAGTAPEEPDLFDMFNANPGVMWRG